MDPVPALPIDPALSNSRSWRSKLAELFGIDPRTLAFSRMAVALVLLYNLATRGAELTAMYSDSGLFPIADVAHFLGSDTWRWSLHMLDGSTMYQGILFGIAAFFAVLLLLGLFTRTATVASWVLLVSLHNRVPVLVTGGDVLLLMLLFWGMFLPWGRRASVDGWLGGYGKDTVPILSVASGAVLIQIAFMYFFTAFSKCNYLWFEGRALESVFTNPLFTRPLGVWFAQFPQALKALTFATLVLELVGPLLMFSPWKTRKVRIWTVGCFVLLHLGIEATMYVVIFSHASLAALTLFTPSVFWESAFVRRVAGGVSRDVVSHAEAEVEPVRVRHRMAALAASAVCVVALVFVLTVNPLLYFGSSAVRARVPRAVLRLDELFGWGQRWSMFACPATYNYRYVAVADLRDGRTVDIMRNRTFTGDERPEEMSLDPPSQRWVQIMVDFVGPGRQVLRESFTRYLARQWNATHVADEQIEHVQLALIFEDPDAKDLSSSVQRVVLARYDPLTEGTYRDGKRDGDWIYYYPNGQKEAIGRYRDGVENGPWTMWYEDGRLQSQGVYLDGRMDGKWVFHYESGETVEAYFDHGGLVPKPLTQRE